LANESFIADPIPDAIYNIPTETEFPYNKPQ